MPNTPDNSSAFYEEVGQRIYKYRDERGMTQEELASHVSLARTSITNIEKGRQKLLIHTLVDIANALDKSPLDFLPEGVLTNKYKNEPKSDPSQKLKEMVKDLSLEPKNWVFSSSKDIMKGE